MRCAIPGILSALVAAAAVSAAPFLDRPPAPTGENVSVADIRSITFEIRPMPQRLRDLRVTTTQVLKIFRTELEGLGLRIVPKRAENIPHVVLSVRAATDTKQREAVALYTIITVHQDVHLKRLDRPMRVATNTTADLHLTTFAAVRMAVPRRVRHAVQVLGKILADATSTYRDMP